MKLLNFDCVAVRLAMLFESFVMLKCFLFIGVLHSGRDTEIEMGKDFFYFFFYIKFCILN